MDLAWKISYDNYQKCFALYPGSPRMMQANTQLEIQNMHNELNALKKPKFYLNAAINVLLFIGYVIGCVICAIYVPWPLNTIFSILYVILWVVLSDAMYLFFRRAVRGIVARHRGQILASHQLMTRHMVIYAGKIYFEMLFVPHSFNHNFNYPNVVPIIVDGFNPASAAGPQGYPTPAVAPIPEIHLTPAPLPDVNMPNNASQVSFYQPPRNVPLYGELTAARPTEPKPAEEERAEEQNGFFRMSSAGEWPQPTSYKELKSPSKKADAPQL